MKLTPKGHMSIATNKLKNILEKWEEDHNNAKKWKAYEPVINKLILECGRFRGKSNYEFIDNVLQGILKEVKQ